MPTPRRRTSREPVNDAGNLTAVRCHDDIARRAYELYEARGRDDGRDFDDWLEAERELRRANSGAGDVAV